jgi:hypothetical protein
MELLHDVVVSTERGVDFQTDKLMLVYQLKDVQNEPYPISRIDGGIWSCGS